MLAKETDAAFSDNNWIYEMKWDGFRAIAEVKGQKVKLYSRNGNSFNAAYPLVVHALADLGINAVVDGEIIIVDEEGRSDFQKLQLYGSDSAHPMEYRVFDLLFLEGKNLCELPLLERKEMLRKLIGKGNTVVKYSDHIKGKGIEFFELAKQKDLEGIIAKKADSQYYPGVRSSSWLKIKYHKSTEAIIAGFTAPGGSRKHFGALILGVRDGKRLKYVGHTGSGFNSKSLASLRARLEPLIRDESPFSERVKTNQPATWVEPRLVCEIKFTEWTRDGLLRHPIFLRLREDKKPAQVTMEAVKPVKKGSTSAPSNKKVKAAKKAAPAPKPAAGAKQPAKKKSKAGKEETFLTFGRTKVRVTNLQKVFWPDEGITKGDVIEYYRSISKYILPYLKDRPESLKRNPNGIRDFGFFHKDAGDEAPEWVKSVKMYSESTSKYIDYILCNNAATLAYMNNLGCIEINPWHSTAGKPDRPDYLIIDIDPSEKNTFEQVIEAANVVRGIFDKAGAESFCKTSGASGLHVYVAAGKKYTYDQLKDFAHLVCMLTVDELPGFTTLERSLKKRGNKKIYMDYLQNRKGQTISSVYSLRPKEGATVSMPLKWKEVKPGLRPSDFTIYNALKRIERTGDIFAGVLGKGFDLAKALKRLGAARGGGN